MHWPPPLLREACIKFWQTASFEERKQILGVQCGCAVVYLKIAEALLVARSPLAETLVARQRYLLDAIEWRMEPPRHVLPGDAVCCDETFMHFVLELCGAPLDAFLTTIQHARSPLVPVDRVNRRLASGRADTWTSYAKEFWSVLLFDMVLHMEAASNRFVCLKVVQDLLERPFKSSERRSWPSAKLFKELKHEWGSLSVEEKVRLSTMSSCEYWFIQACDLATATANFQWLKKAGLQPNQDAPIFQPEVQGTVLSSLRVEVGPELYLMMSDDFVQRKDCLDLLHQKGVTSLVEKEEIVRLVYCFRYESIFEGGKVGEAFRGTSSWQRVERLLATLLLDQLVGRLKHIRAIRRFKLEKEQEEAFAQLTRKQELTRKKRLRALRKREEAAAAREAAAKPPEEREEGDSDAPDACVDAKAAIRALLERSPCWDTSSLRVTRTFFEVWGEEEEKECGSVGARRYARDC